MTSSIRTVFPSKGGGASLLLSKVIAETGEATFYETGDPGIVAKLYRDPAEALGVNIAALVKSPPVDPSLHPGHKAFIWPLDSLLDSRGKFAGVLLPIMAEEDRSAAQLTANESEHSYAAAASLAFAVAQLRHGGFVPGSLDNETITMNRQGLVTLTRFEDFMKLDPAETRDRLTLAVSIFRLLFNASPFSGDWRGSGDPATLAENVAAGRWVWGGDGFLAPPPSLPGVKNQPEDLIRNFDRAFLAGAADPDARPTAVEWHEILYQLVSDDPGAVDTMDATVRGFEHALARGDSDLALELWRKNPALADKATDSADTIVTLQRRAELLKAQRQTKPAEKQRRPVGPLLASPPTIMIREPDVAETVSGETEKPVVTYRIEAGWLDLKPARLTIRASQKITLPELELIDRLTGQALVSCPAGQIIDKKVIDFPQPVTPTVVILTVAGEGADAINIVSPPVRNRTIGAPAGPPAAPPHVRKVFLNAKNL